MQDSLESIILGGGLVTAAQREALEQDPALKEAVYRWLHIRAELSQRLGEVLPERRLFVLHALVDRGYGEVLTREERKEVEDSQEAIAQAVEMYPALEDVAAQIEEDRKLFLECWEEQPARVLRLVPATRVWRIAAAIALLVGFGSVFALLRGGGNETIRVAEGLEQQVELPDGSMVLMVGEAALEYAKGDFSRSVALDGSAFFDVAHAEVPFTITTPQAAVTVLGTRFGLRSTDGVTELVLQSGRVAFAAHDWPDEGVVLEPGQKSVVVQGDLPTSPVFVDLMDALGWTGHLFLDATPMSEVVRILEERFQVSITLDTALLSDRVSGTFEPADTPQQILTVLATALDAEVVGTASEGFTVRR